MKTIKGQEYGSANTPAQPYIRPTMDGDMSKARAEIKKVFVKAEVGIEGRRRSGSKRKPH